MSTGSNTERAPYSRCRAVFTFDRTGVPTRPKLPQWEAQSTNVQCVQPVNTGWPCCASLPESGALRPAPLSVPPADEPRRSQSPSTPSRRMLWAGAPASFGRHIDSILINFGGPSQRAVGLVVVAYRTCRARLAALFSWDCLGRLKFSECIWRFRLMLNQLFLQLPLRLQVEFLVPALRLACLFPEAVGPTLDLMSGRSLHCSSPGASERQRRRVAVGKSKQVGNVPYRGGGPL
jgi:hypothetical protein